MKKMIFILALTGLLMVTLGGLALANPSPLLVDVLPPPLPPLGANPPLPLGLPHLNSNNTGSNVRDIFVAQDGTFDSLVRAVPGQRVHTDFQLDTNSCASCHMTHTAVGRSLLFQRTVTDTCVACHDGTIGILSVLAAPSMTNRFGGSETAGTFGVTDDFNGSVHNVDNQMTVSGAPGGNRDSTADSAGLVSTGWAGTFSCASCHAPHGSYSIRLLHSNPNFLGWRDSNPREATNFATGGLWNRGNTLTVSGISTTHPVHGAVHNVTVAAAIYNIISPPWLYGHASATTLDAPRTVGGHTFPAGRYNRSATRIYATNLSDPNTAADGGGPFSTVVDGVYLLNSFFEINYMTGAIAITPANRTSLLLMGADLATLRIDLARALVVTAERTPGRDVRALNHINTETYGQLTYNRFCAACHTDYLPQGVPGAERRAGVLPGGYGTYSAAHRHTVNRAATKYGTMTVTGVNLGAANQLLCVSCHFAHGADSRMMRQANASLNSFTAPAVDINPSSAMKRYVNQAVCWSCHTNSAAQVFRNTRYFWDGYEANRGYRW